MLSQDKQISTKRTILLTIGLITLAGCDAKPVAPVTAPQPSAPKVVAPPSMEAATSQATLPIKPPTEAILFQPQLIWEDGYKAMQGTGSFVKAPDGSVVALTSAHFLAFEGPALKEVRWLDVRSYESVASMNHSWGRPGDGGSSDARRVIDLRKDYLLMPTIDVVPEGSLLELDPRALPELNEAIWFPDKDPAASAGYRLVTGKIVSVAPEFHVVELNGTIKPVSQSGSPIISQRTGKAIGIWGRVLTYPSGKIHLYLVPSRTLLDVLEQEKSRPALEDVVGQKGASRKE